MKMTRIWDILKKFKGFCNCRGWKTSENEDWVEIDENYHNFLCTREVHPSSFKRITSDNRCVIREGLSYHVVEASYTAWLFSKTPAEDVVRAICENPEFSRRIALYDLSQIAEGKNLCVKLNNTDSHVFQEFENFLRSELKVRVEPFSPIRDGRTTTSSYETIAVA